MNTARQQADDWVQQGFRHQQAGDVPAAQQAYRNALQLHAQQPAALQLLGLLARRQGDAQLAESLWRESLQADARQPHVHNNLGNLLHSVGRPLEALACFEQALALEPQFVDALYNLARVLHAQGRAGEAAQALQRALAAAPQPTAALLQLQASLEEGRGELRQALTSLDRALALAPDKPALLHNRATLLQRLHRPAEALQAHRRAQALGLDAADAHYNLGNTLQSLGRPAEAAAAYRAALARQPAHALALYDLARLRWRQGEPGFDDELRAATAAHPTSAVAPGVHAHLLVRADRHAEAAVAFEIALQREPRAAGFHDGLARCLARLGRFDDSLARHAQALALAPQDAALHTHHATTLLMARRPLQAQQQAEAACTLAPADQHAWAVLGLCWRVNNDPREAWLNDLARFVAIDDLAPPPGFADMTAFNDALAAELGALHRDRAAPLDQTLRGGTQTSGDIFEQGHPLVDALKSRITEAIDRYIAALPSDASHPFLRRRSGAWRYSDSWSSRLGRGGHHTHHVHPHGWLSSAYYVTVPPVASDLQRREGWLQLGEPDFDAGLQQAARTRVQPRPGRLVLFPSMLWHGTTPFNDAAPRLTIAFDVMPR